jgi:hypothetical protein
MVGVFGGRSNAGPPNSERPVRVVVAVCAPTRGQVTPALALVAASRLTPTMSEVMTCRLTTLALADDPFAPRVAVTSRTVPLAATPTPPGTVTGRAMDASVPPPGGAVAVPMVALPAYTGPPPNDALRAITTPRARASPGAATAGVAGPRLAAPATAIVSVAAVEIRQRRPTVSPFHITPEVGRSRRTTWTCLLCNETKQPWL